MAVVDLALPLPLALGSSLLWGVSDFAGGMAARDGHIFRVLVVTAPFSWFVTIVLVPVMGADFSWPAVLWGLSSGVASTAASGLFYRCLAIGPMGLLSPLAAVLSALLPVLAALAMGELLSHAAVIGTVLAVAAAVLISWGPSSNERVSGRGLGYAGGAGVAIALQLICLDRAPGSSGLAPLVVAGGISTLLVLVAVFLTRTSTSGTRPAVRSSLVAGLLGSLANIAFLLAVRDGPLSIVAVITALYPVGTVVLARYVLAERLIWTQLAGLAVAAAALVVFTLG